MADTIRMTLRMEANTKEKFEAILNDLGMNMTTGMNLFAKAVIRRKGIPFEIVQEEPDPFYSPYNLSRLDKSIQEMRDGNVIIKSSEDLGLDDDDY